MVRVAEQGRGSMVLVVKVTMSVAGGKKKPAMEKDSGSFSGGSALFSASSDCVCFLTSFNKHPIDKTSTVNLLSTVKNHDQHTVLLLCSLIL